LFIIYVFFRGFFHDLVFNVISNVFFSDIEFLGKVYKGRKREIQGEKLVEGNSIENDSYEQAGVVLFVFDSCFE